LVCRFYRYHCRATRRRPQDGPSRLYKAPPAVIAPNSAVSISGRQVCGILCRRGGLETDLPSDRRARAASPGPYPPSRSARPVPPAAASRTPCDPGRAAGGGQAGDGVQTARSAYGASRASRSRAAAPRRTGVAASAAWMGGRCERERLLRMAPLREEVQSRSPRSTPLETI
jgi:hypothetical protein